MHHEGTVTPKQTGTRDLKRTAFLLAIRQIAVLQRDLCGGRQRGPVAFKSGALAASQQRTRDLSLITDSYQQLVKLEEDPKSQMRPQTQLTSHSRLLEL